MIEERMSKVVVGKIHISNWAKDAFESRLITLLSTKKKYEQASGKGAGRFFWTFSNFIEGDLYDDKALFARLVKIKKQTNETVFDEANWSPARLARDSPYASFSNFMIFPIKHIILFEDVSSISINIFKQMFSSMYAQLFSGMDLSSMWMDPLVDKENILLRLKEFDKVTKIRLVVTPSNPDSGDWRTMGPLLKDSHIAKGILELSNEEGLRIEGTMISETLNLATMGHGSPLAIYAKKGDEEQVIIPDDGIKRLRVPYSDNAETFAQNLTQLYIKSMHDGGSL